MRQLVAHVSGRFMIRMRSLSLHTKTTLLTSAITLAALSVFVVLISIRVADDVRGEQKELAGLQAVNLAEHISQMPSPRDPQELARAAALVKGARPDAVSVRIWERVGGVFVEVAASATSEPADEIPEETKAALRGGLASKSISVRPTSARDSLYRVFAPVTEGGRLSGAVEVIERLDDAPSIAMRYEQSAIWLALAAVVLITIATYFLFRRLVYGPVGRLLSAMGRAKAGDLQAEAPLRAGDELGLLSREFNSLIARLREMTEEREEHSRLLQELVREATSDIEQQRQQLEEAYLLREQMQRRLIELNRLAAAGQTAAQFAHEVGTPLNLISGHVQLLRASLPPDAVAAGKRLETISTQIERIERIVRRMLDRTRPDTTEMERLDLNALLRRIFDATAPALEAQGVRLRASLHQSLPHINGDADRLQQVFLNLINNSLDATREGGELNVSTFLKHDDGDGPQVFVDFADTGCGMTPEVRAHIFDPLYTTKERGRGTGLGLVVVSQAISDHGGSLEVESETGQGTRFRLRFPAATRHGAPDEAPAVATADQLVPQKG
ncbi:MAG: HAMP domain-containing protein [Acidobacteria bacterium]|nr:HAMP domain-containing protein [Acidobacteriota bacterium]